MWGCAPAPRLDGRRLEAALPEPRRLRRCALLPHELEANLALLCLRLQFLRGKVTITFTEWHLDAACALRVLAGKCRRVPSGCTGCTEWRASFASRSCSSPPICSISRRCFLSCRRPSSSFWVARFLSCLFLSACSEERKRKEATRAWGGAGVSQWAVLAREEKWRDDVERCSARGVRRRSPSASCYSSPPATPCPRPRHSPPHRSRCPPPAPQRMQQMTFGKSPE